MFLFAHSTKLLFLYNLLPSMLHFQVCKLLFFIHRSLSRSTTQAIELQWRSTGLVTRLDADRAALTALNVAEAHLDYAYGEMFPHDVNLDQTGGVSFETTDADQPSPGRRPVRTVRAAESIQPLEIPEVE